MKKSESLLKKKRSFEEFSVAYAPQQNGVQEKTTQQWWKELDAYSYQKFSLKFCEATHIVAYILIRIGIIILKGKSPLEA